MIEALAGGERCVCDLATQLELGQSKLSFHLKVMKLAGLSSPGEISTPCCASAGLRIDSACSTLWVAARVLTPYSPMTPTSTPGCPSIRASPKAGDGASATSATSLILTGALPAT